MKKRFILVALIALILMTIVLALANRQVVTVHYLFGRFQLPLILVIFGSILVGVVLSYLFNVVRFFQLKHRVKQLTEDKAELERQLSQQSNSDV